MTSNARAYAWRYAWICSAAGCSGCSAGAGKSENAVIARLVFVCIPGHTPLWGAAVHHCPPTASPASNTVTSKPASSACFAAARPDGPAPMIATRAPPRSLTRRHYTHRRPAWRRARRLDLVAPQQRAADDHALDLRRALADQQQRRVAVQALDLVLLGVPVAPVDAERVLDDLLAGLGGEQLRHAGLEVRALAGVLHPRGLEREQAGGLDLGGHVGELELDRLVLRDRLAERRALLRVAQGEFERALADAHAARGDVHAADLERVHHLREALVQAGLLTAQHGRAVDLEAVEHQLGGLDALVTQL